MKGTYKDVIELLENHQYEDLNNYPFKRLEEMNWVVDVFEGIHLAEDPNKTALLWTDGHETVNYSFKEISSQTNKLLNFLRKKGVAQGDVLFNQMMLQPLTWISILANIKGGFQMIPAASILGTHDVKYRFKRTFPKLVFADQENAYKTDEAEELLGE